MALLAGARLGPYEVISALAAGGMGEVYKARDTRLDRSVAIKVLPEIAQADPHVRERFNREARVVAALNHPHICTIYDVGQELETSYLVMELLAGETLATRLERGAVPLADALRIAVDVASGLDAAHRAGIVHRDLKPANIMLTNAGAKLLDFGLAKSRAPVVTGTGFSILPTTSVNLTAEGTILGTFQYMAPEQLEGRDADGRTDIFAFGAVAYEMLTGTRAFEGTNQAGLIGAILHLTPPPISASQPLTPPSLDHVVSRCLSKDPDERWQTASDLMRELKWIAASGAAVPSGVSAVTPIAQKPRTWILTAMTIIAAAAGLAFAIPRVLTGPAADGLRPRHATRFAIVPPADAALVVSGTERDVTILPGDRVVYVGGSGRLFLRTPEDLAVVPIPGVVGAAAPFASPDGRSIGYFAGTGELKRVSVAGGPSTTICRFDYRPRGASWGTDDTIVFATDEPGAGLFQVPAAGGEPRVLTRGDVKQGERLWWPQILPGGQAVLFTIWSPAGVADPQVAVLNLKTRERKVLMRASHAQYLPTGHLVYGVAGTLEAAAFDTERLEVIGKAVRVAEQVSPNFAVSPDGTLVYVPSTENAATAARRTLVWVDRQGHEEAVGAESQAYGFPRLSADGTRIAVHIEGANTDIFVYDLARKTLRRLTLDKSSESRPVWSPDGRWVYFRSDLDGPGVYRKAADGSGAMERVTPVIGDGSPQSFSPNGRTLLFGQVAGTTARDLWTIDLNSPSEAKPLVVELGVQGNPVVSPDGRWLAYDEDGSIWVRPFPNVAGARWQVSAADSKWPFWSHDGRELFFLSGRALVTVPVESGSQTFQWGSAKTLFEASYAGYPGVAGPRNYDVSPDGRRFLMIKEGAVTAFADTPLVVVESWSEELQRLVTTTR